MKDHGVELTEEDHSNRRPGVFWIAIAGAFLIGLGVFAYFASVVVNFPGEVSASTWVQSWRSSWLDAVTKATYLPGTLQAAIPLVLLTSAAFFVKGMRAESALILTTSVLGQLITFVLKELVARPRPSSDLVQVLQQTNSFSFPSGHATFYIVFLGTLVFILSMNMRAGSARKLGCVDISSEPYESTDEVQESQETR